MQLPTLTKSELNLLIKTALPTIKRRIKLAQKRIDYLSSDPNPLPSDAPTQIAVQEMIIKDLENLRDKSTKIYYNTPIKIG